MQLQKSSSVQVRIAEQSGRVQCAPLQAVFNNTVNNRIVRCGKAVNEARGSLPDALLKLRVTVSGTCLFVLQPSKQIASADCR